MERKIAVAFIHGIGHQEKGFAEPMIAELQRRLRESLGLAAGAEPLECEPVHWADVLQPREERLVQLTNPDGALRYEALRKFLIGSAADAIAYQPTPWDRHVYDDIHARVAAALRALARRAGPDAPLCVVAHSLGTVIASNYLYDLQASFRQIQVARHDPTQPLLPAKVLMAMGDPPTPLERGETLTHLFTMGSPLALWALRHSNSDPEKDFGAPIAVPSPHLATRHGTLAAEGSTAGWYNLYDADDVIAYPLRGLNPAYARAVRADLQVNVGNFAEFWNPLSHNGYWTDGDALKPIAAALAGAWRAVNPGVTRAATSRPA